MSDLAEFYRQQPIPKPESRKRVKGRKQRAQQKDTNEIRAYVFARERDVCRCCRKRKAESMHEIVCRGRRGKVSKANSIAVCGRYVGTRCCHTYLQRNEIYVEPTDLGAEGTLGFLPITPKAREWMGLKKGAHLLSPPMIETEQD